MWRMLISVIFITLVPFNEKDDIRGGSSWKETRSSGGVKTYVRLLDYGNGRQVRERKGEMLATCSLDEAVRILSSADAVKSWMSGISENYRIATSGPYVWHTYTLFKIPWPFKERDLVSYYELKRDTAKSSCTIHIRSDAGRIPLKEGIERLTSYTAQWFVTEVSHGNTKIVFSALSDMPPMFPRYIQDPVIEGIFHNNMVRLRELLSD